MQVQIALGVLPGRRSSLVSNKVGLFRLMKSGACLAGYWSKLPTVAAEETQVVKYSAYYSTARLKGIESSSCAWLPLQMTALERVVLYKDSILARISNPTCTCQNKTAHSSVGYSAGDDQFGLKFRRRSSVCSIYE